MADNDEIYHSNSDEKISANEFSDSSDGSNNSHYAMKKTSKEDESNYKNLDFDLLFYVFEFVIQRYYRLKKSAKEGQQGLNSEEKPHEVLNLEPIAFSKIEEDDKLERSENIVGITEIEKRNIWYFHKVNKKG